MWKIGWKVPSQCPEGPRLGASRPGDLALFWKPFLSLLSCQPPSVCALYSPSARLREDTSVWRFMLKNFLQVLQLASGWWVCLGPGNALGVHPPRLLLPLPAPEDGRERLGWGATAQMFLLSFDSSHIKPHKREQSVPAQHIVGVFLKLYAKGLKKKRKKKTRKIHRHMEQQRGGENAHRQPVTMFRQIFRLFIWKNDVSFIYTFKIWLEDIISQCFPPSIFSNTRLKKVSLVISC